MAVYTGYENISSVVGCLAEAVDCAVDNMIDRDIRYSGLKP